MMNRAERRKKTFAKLVQRGKMLKDLGKQGGSLFKKHVAKVQKSLGYMDGGNVTHFVSPSKPRIHTQSHENYGSKFNPSKRDATKLDSLRDQDFEEEAE